MEGQWLSECMLQVDCRLRYLLFFNWFLVLTLDLKELTLASIYLSRGMHFSFHVYSNVDSKITFCCCNRELPALGRELWRGVPGQSWSYWHPCGSEVFRRQIDRKSSRPYHSRPSPQKVLDTWTKDSVSLSWAFMEFLSRTLLFVLYC